MIGFVEMLVKPAKKAGMSVPEDLEGYDPEEYPHWHVYTICQIGAPLTTFTEHWDNAKVIAEVPDDRIKEVYLDDLEELGLQI